MKWRGGGGGLVGMRGAVVVVVVVVALQLQLGWSAALGDGDSRPVEVFVPAEEGLGVGSVYRVTVRGVADGGASGLCCQVVDLRGGVGGNRSVEVECSYGGAGELVGDLASGGCACLVVESLLGGDGYGKVQLDSALALSAFLGWISRDGSAGDEMQALLHTQGGECLAAEEDKGRLCQLSVTSSVGLVPGIPSSLASVELGRGIFNRMQLATPREIKATMRLVSKSLPSTGSGSDSARSSNSSAYLRGGSARSLDSNRTSSTQERYLIILSDSREDHGYGGIQARSARVGYLGRRLLRAKVGYAAHSSYRRCEHGRLLCVHWVGLSLGVVITLAGLSMLAILCAGSKEDETPADFLDTVPSLPPRFSYSKLQKATKNFSRKLGDGAFGSVYEGTLPNGARVAVKMLEKTSVQGEKQFRAEVASMGAIRHLNLVRLHGFCSEGAHRLLVYEFMPNGSLDAWLFGKKQGEKLLDWEQRLNIALGTARALAYLHEECSDHIIHLDVKPENILLDHQFCPKLSDFGLAKLMDREQSRVVTSMRGTPGYLAPEWLLPHAAVTAKTDVYSFGMVLLELISGRENTNFSLGKEQWYFPAWAFKLMGEGRTMELLDKRLHVEEVEYFHKKDAMRAIHCALLCIQDDPSARPPMSRVVHMLQGHVEPEPLNARQSAIQPPRRLLTAFAASRSDVEANHAQQDQHQNDGRNDMHHQAVGPAVSTRIPVAESPRVKESPRVMNLAPSPRTLQEMDRDQGEHFDRMEPLPPAVQMPNQARGQNTSRMAGAHSLSNNQKSIPPWPVKGDIILTRGPNGDQHCVVRDVRVQGKQMRLAILHRLSSETRWSVRDEEQSWRNWNESIKTLDFWVVVRWSTIPGRGFEKYPVEWMTR
ncbi:hypothetical protein M758_5G018500 [Ceratodon purpureus]|nr:hypothetical protein M758_5G018500 [Ceratodon purpureus]